MKLGILGTGMIVREFLPWLAGPDCPFTVQALCSTQRSAPMADEMCEQYGIPQHTTNYFELLQWVDVIYLAVPNLQHYRYAKVALEMCIRDRFKGLFPGCLALEMLVQLHGFHDLVADGLQGVQAGHGVLHDHGDLMAPDLQPVLLLFQVGKADGLAVIGTVIILSLIHICMVVEGMNALPAALELAAKYQVEMPIVQTVNAVVNKGMSAAEAVRSLMDRDPKNELPQSYEK